MNTEVGPASSVIGAGSILMANVPTSSHSNFKPTSAAGKSTSVVPDLNDLEEMSDGTDGGMAKPSNGGAMGIGS